MDNSSSSTGSLPKLDQEFRGDDVCDSNMEMDLFRRFFELDKPPTQSESESKLKRNSPSETNIPSERKRMADKRYRERRKGVLEKTKVEIDYLRNKLFRLAQENEVLKMEVLDKNKSLQSLEETMEQFQENLDQMKTQNQSQSVLVRVISEQLCFASDVDLRRENAILKKQNERLMNLIDDPRKFEIFNLEQEKAESERETGVLKVIVEALCGKIYHNEKQQVL